MATVGVKWLIYHAAVGTQFTEVCGEHGYIIVGGGGGQATKHIAQQNGNI